MCLYAWILDVGRCADLVPVFFFLDCGTLCRSSFCMLRFWLWDSVQIWFLYASVLVVERCADFFLYVVFFCHWAGCTFASILCSLRLNFQPGVLGPVWGGGGAVVEEAAQRRENGGRRCKT